MRIIRKCIPAIFTLYCSLCIADEGVLHDKGLQKKIDNIVLETKHAYGMSAVEMSVVSLTDGKMLSVANGRISIESDQSINNSSIFQIASITKTFTAYMILNI